MRHRRHRGIACRSAGVRGQRCSCWAGWRGFGYRQLGGGSRGGAAREPGAVGADAPIAAARQRAAARGPAALEGQVEDGAPALRTPEHQRVFALVLDVVRGRGHEPEICRLVVLPVAVHVVDYLGPEERAAEQLLHDEAMQEGEAASGGHTHVAKAVEAAGPVTTPVAGAVGWWWRADQHFRS